MSEGQGALLEMFRRMVELSKAEMPGSPRVIVMHPTWKDDPYLGPTVRAMIASGDAVESVLLEDETPICVGLTSSVKPEAK